MSKKSAQLEMQRVAMDAAEALTLVRQRFNQAYTLMNTYAKDPYDLGSPTPRISGTSPHAILAEVYGILAPAQLAVMEFFSNQERAGVLYKLTSLREETVEAEKRLQDAKKYYVNERRRLARMVEHQKREAKRDTNKILTRHSQIMAELKKIEEQRKAEVDAYLFNTQRHVRVQTDSRRKIEI